MDHGFIAGCIQVDVVHHAPPSIKSEAVQILTPRTTLETWMYWHNANVAKNPTDVGDPAHVGASFMYDPTAFECASTPPRDLR
jgi:hypothetical protein